MHTIKTNAKELSEQEIADLKENAQGVLSIVRTKMINMFPFIGTVAMKLETMPTRDIRNPTACTDANTIFFDIDFLSSLSDEQKLFVFAHEVYHCVMMHFLRTETRNRGLFNIATDLEVNQLLKADGLSCPSDCCLPEKFDVPEGLSAEQYYDLLLKQQNQQKQKKQQGGGSGGSGKTGGGQRPKKGGGKGGNLSGQFDKHLYQDDELSEIGPGDNGGATFADKYGKISFDEDFTPSTSSQQTSKKVNSMKEAVIGAAQAVERSRGALPAHLKNIVNQLLACETPWQEVLQNFTTRHIGDERMWNPPSRRHVWSGNYLQSRRGRKVSVGVVLDTSGSTSSDIPKFLGELNGIVSSFGNYCLEVVECDASVQNHTTYDEGNPLDLENTKFEVHGGGGTVLEPGLKYFAENGLEVDCICVFTDGYCEHFKQDMDPGVPVLWMVTKGGQTTGFDFGEVHEFKNH